MLIFYLDRKITIQRCWMWRPHLEKY